MAVAAAAVGIGKATVAAEAAAEADMVPGMKSVASAVAAWGHHHTVQVPQKAHTAHILNPARFRSEGIHGPAEASEECC